MSRLFPLPSAPSKSAPLKSALLTPALVAVCAAAFVPCVAAQDPAAVGGGSDPALVGGRGYAPGPSRSGELSFEDLARAGEDDPERAAREVETLLSQVRSRLSGTQGGDARDADRGEAIRYRNDAEVLIRRNWNKLGPLTRDLYTSQYDRTDPNDPNQRYRSPYGDNGQIERDLLGGVDDAQQAMQSLEDLLLPMLQDLKRGFDAELRNRANSR